MAVTSRPPTRKLIEASRVVAIIPKRIELRIPIATTTQARTLVKEAISIKDWYFIFYQEQTSVLSGLRSNQLS